MSERIDFFGMGYVNQNEYNALKLIGKKRLVNGFTVADELNISYNYGLQLLRKLVAREYVVKIKIGNQVKYRLHRDVLDVLTKAKEDKGNVGEDVKEED